MNSRADGRIVNDPRRKISYGDGRRRRGSKNLIVQRMSIIRSGIRDRLFPTLVISDHLFTSLSYKYLSVEVN